jgi:hypothetical protein
MHGLNIPEKSTRVHHYLEGFHDDMLQLTEILGHSDPRDINTGDIRIISYKNIFARYFDDDPFGVYIPTATELQDNIKRNL